MNSPEAYIALSLFQQEYLNQSLQLAANVQEQFTKRVGRKDRGVQQAGFLVLWKTAMPSILIELGFISNAAEERFLVSETGQAYMASAIYRAFRDFKESYEGENANTKPKTAEVTPVEQPKTEEVPTATPVEKPEVKVEEKPEVQPASKTMVSFKVQFASRDTKVPVTDKAFAKVPEVSEYYYNGAYRYVSGSFSTKQEALDRLEAVRKLGYSDAFVVAFINGERATIKEAENAIKN